MLSCLIIYCRGHLLLQQTKHLFFANFCISEALFDFSYVFPLLKSHSAVKDINVDSTVSFRSHKDLTK